MSMPDVEDFYPLSPLQQGLLFHTLSEGSAAGAPAADGGATGLYHNQTVLGLTGPLDVDAFRRAWQAVVDLHPILRTFFVWEGVERPVQVVKRAASMPLEVEDARGLDEAAQAARLEALRLDDLARGFDLSQPPLMRGVLLRTADDRHELLWSFHHLLMDGWSMFRMLGQVFTTYDALVEGRAPALEKPRPYRDHLVWLSKRDAAASEAYWRRTLAGFGATTPLPADPARHGGDEGVVPDSSDGDFAVLTGALPEETTRALTALAGEHRLTLNTVLQGAWALLLAKSSRESDVVFGAIVSGRPPELDGVEEMVGLFINSLPVRVAVDPEEPLLPWLQRLQVAQAEMREHEHSPLVEVQGWSEVPRGEPLFDSLFLFENYKKDTPLESMCRSLGLVDVRWYERHNFPLAAVAIPGDALSLRVIYQTSRYTAAGLARLLEHWRVLVADMVARPEASLGSLSMLPEDERTLVLETWNDTATEVPDVCAHELFEAAADRDPDALAVSGCGRDLTYGELERRANRLAHALRALGVGRGDRVGLATGRTPELVVGALGAQKAGGAYVACDLGVPATRLAAMFEDSGARVVLATPETVETLPEHGAVTLVGDADGTWRVRGQGTAGAAGTVSGGGAASGAGAGAGAATGAGAGIALPDDDSRPAPLATPRDLAYVIYTSGSTGTPKGVELEHRGLVNLTLWHRRVYDVTPDDRATHLAGLGFDASVWELWPYVTAGASLHLVDDETRLAPDALLAFFARHRITQAFVPTPLAEAMLRLDMPDDLALEVVFTGGDKLNRAPDRALPFRLVNHYGPTENTVVATAVEVPPDPDDDTAPTIGRPIHNVRCLLLDSDMAPVPVGVPGELFVGGRSLARGYVGRPDLTAASFVPDPFHEGERLYATGDLGRWTVAGEIEFLGRRDAQVKVRGYRIELGEVETVLGRHAAVREAVVLAREDVPGNKQLVGYVTLEEGASADDPALRAHCATTLPGYMVPTAVVVMDAFPLAGSGKVDRRALPAPESERPELTTAYEAPGEGLEATLAGLWRDALKLERVGRTDNVFDLGGNSILMIAVHGKLQQALGRSVPMVELFRHPTVASLARFLEGDDEPAPPEDARETGEKLQAGRSRLARLQQRRRRS